MAGSLETMDFSGHSHDQLVDLLRQAGKHLRENGDRIKALTVVAERVHSAEAEAEHWKSVADSLEFGPERPNFSPPPRADGA